MSLSVQNTAQTIKTPGAPLLRFTATGMPYSCNDGCTGETVARTDEKTKQRAATAQRTSSALFSDASALSIAFALGSSGLTCSSACTKQEWTLQSGAGHQPQYKAPRPLAPHLVAKLARIQAKVLHCVCHRLRGDHDASTARHMHRTALKTNGIDLHRAARCYNTPHAARNLDDSAEDLGVVVARCERGDGHHLGDGTESKHLRIAKPRHVLQAVRGVRHGVGHLHNTQAGQLTSVCAHGSCDGTHTGAHAPGGSGSSRRHQCFPAPSGRACAA